ncbi:DHA2 family efflux MFS transporter permease subunit [Chitinibacter tainanensis]|uniref:DHA2 family efflux MFS transporter permease subunit n=1 Tax=Chitinibacter tainanensis TaxID=230667 RepID=UPI00041CC407|nr:DHA2 family efflux MFS transporter permease subunit [Chitinibacter tainanensis]
MKAILPGLSRSTDDASIHQHRYIIALTVTLACVLELLDTSIVNVAIPHMMGTLGATLDEITWVSIGYVVANVIVLPISGFLGNLFGRRNYLVLSIGLFIVASIACGNSSSLPEMVFWRIVQGLGGGGLIATAQTTLFEVFPSKEMGSAMAIFGMGIMLGPMLGPTVGGWLTDQYSWPWIFYINLPLGLAALLLTLIYVPESKLRKAVTHIDFVGLALMAGGIAALQLLLERGERLEWFDSWEIVIYSVTSIAALGAFIIRQLEHRHPLVDLRVCQDVQFSAGLVITFLLGGALFSTVFIFPVYVQTLMGYTAWQTGLLILPSALASGLTMPISAKLVAKGMPPRILISLGASIFLGSMWLHHGFTTQSGVGDFMGPLILRGIGLGMIFMPLNSLTMANLQPSQIGSATGLYNLTRQLGGSVGIALSATFSTKLMQMHGAALLEHLGGFAALERLAQLKARLISTGTPAAGADTLSQLLLQQTVNKQALMLAYDQLFLLFGIAMICVLPLLLLMPNSQVRASADAAH